MAEDTKVASRADAWIETWQAGTTGGNAYVASRADAWIETSCDHGGASRNQSRPARTRGLKLKD